MTMHALSNRKLTILLTGLASVIFCCTAKANAQPNPKENIRYISDILFVPLRSGQGAEYRIVNAALKSGMKLEYIQTGESGKWTKVRTPSGTEGWIRSQYLIKEETGRLRYSKAQAELAQLKKSNKQLLKENKKLKQSNNNLSKQSSSDSQARTEMANELERIKNLSANSIELEKRYRKLLEEHQLLKTDKDILTAEKEKLKNDNQLTFMIYGVGILLLGVLLAYILPALKPKKSYSEWR